MRTRRWQQVSPAFAVYMRLRSGDVRSLTGEQRRALDMLAGSPNGCTEGLLRAHGFTVGLLAGAKRTRY
jgi:hypothetical protein